MADHTNNTWSQMGGIPHNAVQTGSVTGGIHFNNTDSNLPVPQQLPPDVTHFTGRHSFLRTLDALLEKDEEGKTEPVVISAIAGTPGVGKTALAVHWAHRVKDHFPDGILYVNLHGYDPYQPTNPIEVLDGFLKSLNVSDARIPVDLDGKMAMYRSILAKRQVLVVLDNASKPEQVRPLIPGSSTCLVLVTSRSRLSGLAMRDGARSISLGLLSSADAIALLRDIVGPARVDSEIHNATRLAKLCDHLPLALRIVAQRIRTNPSTDLRQLVEELSVERQRLDALQLDHEDESSAIRTVFSWSYKALPPDLRRTFRLLGLHDSPDITDETAAALADVDAFRAKQTLNGLVSVHLIEKYGLHYRFHDLIRVYAGERAKIDEPAEERTAAITRLNAWRAYLNHYRAARLSESLNDRWGAAVQFRTTGEMVLPHRWSERAIDCFEIALTHFRRANDPRQLGKCMYAIAIAYAQLGEGAKSTRYMRMAVEQFAKVGDDYSYTECQRSLDHLA
ncbi:ATP-binding protein [Actinosynnema sp. NPDC091369]